MADEAQNTQPTPSEPLPQAEANVPSEPAQPVEQTAQPETPTAQTPVNEPLPPQPEPIDIPPFDNSPTPLPQTPAPSGTPAQAPQARSGRDLLVKARASIQNRKQKKLGKILELLNAKEKITNDEVEKLLHVSDATATRYLSALEKQGEIKQIGKTGKAVTYSRI